MVGFGSLMISGHHGIHSLGSLVALGVGSVLIASLTTLPGVLALLARRQATGSEASGAYRSTIETSHLTKDKSLRHL